MSNRFHPAQIFITLRTTVITLLAATGWSVNAHAEQVANFEVEFKSLTSQLKDNTTLNVDSIGIRYGERNQSALRLDFLLSRLLAKKRGNMSTNAFIPDGYSMGLELRAETSSARPYRAGASINLGYNSSNEIISGQDRLELVWRQAEARVWLSLQISQRLKLYGCTAAIDIEGDQRHFASGITSVTDFNIEQRAGYCGGLELRMPNDGFIGFEAGGRALRGGRLYFGKYFGA